MPDINYEAWKFWIGVAQLLGTILIGIYVWWSNRNQVNNKRFRTLEESVATKISQEKAEAMIEQKLSDCHSHQKETRRINDELIQLTGRVNGLPSRAELHGLNSNITELNSKIGKMDGRLEGINRVADLMNQFLINQGGKK